MAFINVTQHLEYILLHSRPENVSKQGEKPKFYRDSAIAVAENPSNYNELPDLSDWIGHRILARRPDNYFSTGIIDRIVEGSGDTLVVILEGTPLVYSDVLSCDSYSDIISDAIPATKQVNFVKEHEIIFLYAIYQHKSEFFFHCH